MDERLGSKLDSYRQARRKGAEYLLSHLNADGSVGPAARGFFYYRTPWALATAGETEAATALCAWIRENQFGPSGDFIGVSPRPLVDHYLYANALLVIGAHTLRQFDLSHRGIQHILSLRDPLSGAFHNHGGPLGHSDK